MAEPGLLKISWLTGKSPKLRLEVPRLWFWLCLNRALGQENSQENRIFLTIALGQGWTWVNLPQLRVVALEQGTKHRSLTREAHCLYPVALIRSWPSELCAALPFLFLGGKWLPSQEVIWLLLQVSCCWEMTKQILHLTVTSCHPVRVDTTSSDWFGRTGPPYERAPLLYSVFSKGTKQISSSLPSLKWHYLRLMELKADSHKGEKSRD